MNTNKNENEVVTVGLCAGRHDLPVTDYIFSDVADVFDYERINNTVMEFLRDKVGVSVEFGCGLNQASGIDSEVYVGNKALVVYVTGLTALTVAVVRACALNGVELTLMNYDRESQEYVPQHVF